MRFKSYLIYTALCLVNLWTMTPTASATEAAAVGRFPEEITFTLDSKNLPPMCSVPPKLLLTVDRNHPYRKSILVLPVNSPYSSATIVKSDAFDPTHPNHIRHYVDRLTMKQANNDIVMILKGTKNVEITPSNSGNWTSNQGCSGGFVVTKRF